MNLADFVAATVQVGLKQKNILQGDLSAYLNKLGVSQTGVVTHLFLPRSQFPRKATLEELRVLPPITFEKWCAVQLSQLGWVTMTTKGSGDEGVDILCLKGPIKMVVSVKRYVPTVVPSTEIRGVEGARSLWGGNQAMLITCGRISDPARQAAKDAPRQVILVDEKRVAQPELWFLPQK